MSDRIAYSIPEFAALFGKEQTWAYRLTYDGKVKVITQFGHKMIPSSEVERVLQSADFDDAEPKEPEALADLPQDKPERTAWEKYLKQMASRKPLTEPNMTSAVRKRMFPE